MKRDWLGPLISFVLIGVLATTGLLDKAAADTGSEGAIRKEIGSYISVRTVAGSSYTGTEFFAASRKRPDGSCVNNSATTVWIGTVAATYLNNNYHPNIVSGYPVTSTQPFKLDGSMTGNLYFTCDVGIAACEFRCIDGLVQ